MTLIYVGTYLPKLKLADLDLFTTSGSAFAKGSQRALIWEVLQ